MIDGEREGAYLDNAANTLPSADATFVVNFFMENLSANPGRGVYKLSEQAEELRQKARLNVAEYFGANMDEIVFTSGATMSLNMLAYGLKHKLKPGDEILVSILEHHSNLLPWQRVAKETGAKLKTFSDFSKPALEKVITKKTKIVAVTGESNVTGYQPPLKQISKIAHAKGALVVADLAQYVAHAVVDLHGLDVDYAAWSAHKMGGPMGLGVLYGKRELLDELEPLLLGGGMVEDVSETDFEAVPGVARLEAGTCNMAAIAGYGGHLHNISNLQRSERVNIPDFLSDELGRRLRDVEGVTVYGAEHGVVSFNVAGIHPHDLAWFLSDEYKVSIRAGHMCAIPLMRHLGIEGCCRASFSDSNDGDDIELFLEGLQAAQERLGSE